MTRTSDRRRHRRRSAISIAAVLIVAVVAGLLAQAWYLTLQEGEQQADNRGFEQIAILLLRRIEREGDTDLPAIVTDFDAALRAHVAVVHRDETLLSPGTPVDVRRVVGALQEPDVLRVRRRVAPIEGSDYELFGGATTSGTRAYVVRQAEPPERATTLRPVLWVGWLLAVAVTGVAAFMIGRRGEARLRIARERERSLTSAIAHELRTPLGSVVTAAGLLETQAHQLPPELQRTAALLAEELQRLRSLVEDLLELARLEAGDHAMHLEVVSLADVVRDVLAARSWSEKVRTDLDERAAAAVDRLSVSRIVLNLVDNAFRHGGGQVAICVHADADEVVLEVFDGGTATDVDRLRQLLGGHVTDRAPDSRAGLGLRIAAENAALHDAPVEAAVDPDRGTVLTVRFPAVAPIGDADPLLR